MISEYPDAYQELGNGRVEIGEFNTRPNRGYQRGLGRCQALRAIARDCRIQFGVRVGVGKPPISCQSIGDARGEIACDTVVFTGSWIPDHELARLREQIQLNYIIGAPLSHATFEAFTEKVLPKLL